MRYLYLIILGLCFLVPSAWSTSLFNDQGQAHGFGGFGFKAATLNNDDILTGGRGGLIMDGGLMIGGGGYSNYSDERHELADEQFAYGGLILGYNLNPWSVINLETNLLIGAGYYQAHVNSTRYAFTVLEPEVGANINITPFLRAGLNASWRKIANDEVNPENYQVGLRVEFGDLDF